MRYLLQLYVPLKVWLSSVVLLAPNAARMDVVAKGAAQAERKMTMGVVVVAVATKPAPGISKVDEVQRPHMDPSAARNSTTRAAPVTGVEYLIWKTKGGEAVADAPIESSWIVAPPGGADVIVMLPDGGAGVGLGAAVGVLGVEPPQPQVATHNRANVATSLFIRPPRALRNLDPMYTPCQGK